MEDEEIDSVVPVSGSKEIGALAHLYRSEVYRSTVWRQRLDMTTNWAVVSTGIALSVSFATNTASPLPIPLVGMLTIMFLFLEARRYRYFMTWKFRARLLELALMVPILRGEGAKIALDRGTALSDDYVTPDFHISAWQAIGHRLRRNYLWIFMIQYAAYIAKIWIHPVEAIAFSQMLERAHIGPVHGGLVLAAGTGLLFVFVFLTLWTYHEKRQDTSRMSDYLKGEGVPE